MHRHAAPRCALERRSDSKPGDIGGKNVRFKKDFALRRIDLRFERREKLLPVF
jgi:hypothetical protein